MLRYETTPTHVLTHVRASHPFKELDAHRLDELVNDLVKAPDALSEAQVLAEVIAGTMPAPLYYPIDVEKDDLDKAINTYFRAIDDELLKVLSYEREAGIVEGTGCQIARRQARHHSIRLGRYALAWLGELVEHGLVHFEDDHVLEDGIDTQLVLAANSIVKA